MSAKTVVSNLVTLGVQVKTAWVKSEKDFGTFLSSPEFAAIQTSVERLLASLQPSDLQAAVREIRQRQDAFLRGREIATLSLDELSSFSALADVEHELVNKLLKAPPAPKDFLTVLVKDVLPSLLSVAKVVVPLLV